MSETIAVLNENDLEHGQMKQVPFGEGQILVAKLGDKVHATSAYCTHYGAPLAKGTLTAEGRVVCPWHGACFNVCTGDIEDAPAANAIHSFKTSVQDGKILVTADQKYTKKDDNMIRPPTVHSHAKRTSDQKGVVIVGGGSGALHLINSLRENAYSKPITVISKETYAPIDRTKLSKAEIKDPKKIELRSLDDLGDKWGIDVRLGKTVTSVDAQNKTVTIDGTDEKVEYDQLVLAPGGVPRRLPIPGKDLPNVYTLRHVQDAEKIYNACTEGTRVAVIGSSFISMELVVTLSKKKLSSIDVIGMDEVPFESVLGKEIGSGLKKYHESNGVKFHMKSGVEEIVASPDGSKATAVKLKGGAIINADNVIMGVGVAPATEFLKNSGFTLEKDGGIKVDEYLRVPGVKDVYAIGDIATFPQVEYDEPRRIEHWNVAGNHGRAVGRTISGKGEPFDKIPVFWSAQGQQLRYCGVGAGYDDIILKGDPSSLKFVAYYTKGDKVVAVASMQNDPVVVRCSELMRAGRMPSATEVRNGVNILDSFAAWWKGDPAQDPMKVDLTK